MLISVPWLFGWTDPVLRREAAARFSFLLSAPIIAGAGAKSLLDLAQSVQSGTITGSELTLFPIGFAAVADPRANAAVQTLLDELVGSGEGLGLQVAAYRRGKLVVDAWAGIADACTDVRLP